ncbi:MAG TPA: extracellular solute-binding protein [Chloroflexota bacterium]|nr:extracellular solute-binding protein [Chloroflexota bacterium]
MSAAVSTRRRLGGAAALLALVTPVTAACGAAGERSAPGGSSAREPVTIRWSTWGNENNPMVEGAAKGIDIFRQTFPHVTVKAEPQVGVPGGPSWQEKNFAEWLAGDGPDVSGSCCATLPDWGRQGMLTDLDPLIKRDGREVPLSDYVAAQLNTWKTPQNGQFALPMYMGVFGLYYSRSLFRRKGVPYPDDTWDWDKWREAMVRLTDKSDATWGYMQAINFPRPGILIRQAGGNQVDPKDNTKAVFDSAAAIGAMQWLHDRMHKDRALAQGKDITGTEGLGFKNAYTAVGAGKLGMLLDGSWILARWLKEQPDLTGDWDVAQLPKGAAQRDGGATVDGWAIWKGTKHADVAWDLVKFLQTDAWLEIATSIVGHQPSRKSWQDRFVAVTKKTYPALADKQLEAFVKPIKGDYARPEQFFLKDSEAKKIWSDAVTATFTKNEAPVADAFRKAAEQINELHRA